MRWTAPVAAAAASALALTLVSLPSAGAATLVAPTGYPGTPDSSPFKRAEREMVSVEIKTVIPQTPDTWQVEWVESSRDRQGSLKGPPVSWRALVTTYIAEVTPSTTDEQLRNNPLSIYVRDYSWSRIQ